MSSPSRPPATIFPAGASSFLLNNDKILQFSFQEANSSDNHAVLFFMLKGSGRNIQNIHKTTNKQYFPNVREILMCKFCNKNISSSIIENSLLRKVEQKILIKFNAFYENAVFKNLFALRTNVKNRFCFFRDKYIGYLSEHYLSHARIIFVLVFFFC